MLKRNLWMVISIVGVIIILSACGSENENTNANESNSGDDTSAETEETGTLRLGLVCGGMTPLIAQTGMNDGSFEEAGIEVEEVCFDSGSDAVQALVGGSIDANLGSYEHVLRFASNELDVKAYAQLYNGVGYSLVVREDSEYESLSDLEGEALAVTRAGSLSDTGLRKGLEEENLNPDRDVEIIGSGSGSSMYAAIENEQVAGGMVSEPVLSQMVSSGEFRILYEPDFDYAGIVVMSTTDWVEDNEETMRTFLSELADIKIRSQEDIPAVVEVMQSTFETIEPEVLEQAIENQLERAPEGLSVIEGAAEMVAETAIELGIIEEPVSFDEAVDLSYLP